MTQPAPSLQPTCQSHGEVVRRPRVTDGIGASLRDTYSCREKLPSDWLAALAKLDTIR